MRKPLDRAPSARPASRWRRAAAITAQALLGLGLGAVIAEVAFSWRDDGAFPHANFYVPDPELGVRLEPGASMRFQLRQNPLTTIHVNACGYRGGDWPAPADGEVIVVGDSQVFGLGVEDDATFAAGLAARSGRPVLNAGVPTYGPREYMAVARELLAERRARTVVVALNFVNDPFEVERPNRERHAVWDGWAVRIETAPTEVREFPGRRWLFSKSHAVYALRRWLHARGSAAAPEGAELDDPLDLGTPSEGGLHDLVDASQRAHADAARAQEAASAALAASRARLAGIDTELAGKRTELDHLIFVESDVEFDFTDAAIARGRPGDIVVEDLGESSRSVLLTASLIRKAARERDAAVAALVRDEQRAGKRSAGELVAAEEQLLAERRRLREEIAAGVPPPPRPASLFRAYLAEFKALCDEYGAELVVVALPIDVQVDPAEWAKYGVADPPDMQGSLVLIDDLIADARDLGVRALDATAALRGAEPGAFLDHDIHMTARGHAALADALAATLAAPVVVPARMPAPGLPAGRSFVPTADEWGVDGEVAVKGSTAAGCSTQIQRDWLRVQCRRQRPRDRFDAIEVREGGTPATMALRTADALSLVTPLTPGAPLTVRFRTRDATRDLEVRWPEGQDGAPRFAGAFVDAPGPAAPPEPLPAAAEALCACHQARTDEQFCATRGDPEDDYSDPTGCRTACAELWADPTLADACARAYPKPDDCAARLACAQHDPLFAPPCPEGQVHAFASNACFAVCDDARPCAAGSCSPWQGAFVCL